MSASDADGLEVRGRDCDGPGSVEAVPGEREVAEVVRSVISGEAAPIDRARLALERRLATAAPAA